MTTPAPAARPAVPTRSENFPMRSPLLIAVLLVAGFAPAPSAQIPAHPDALDYPALEFTPPMAEEFRHDLPGGIRAYLAPTDELPLIDITFTFKGGAYLVPKEAAGTASTLGAMMRRGGTTSVSAEDLDERLDFLAADVSTGVGDEFSQASINCLVRNFDEAFGLFMDMVRNPGFDAERLRVHKDQLVEGFKQRNDNPMAVAMSQMPRLIRGADHYTAFEPTVASVEGITPRSLRELHRRIFHPDNVMVSATGDFEVEWLVEKLTAAFAGWATGPLAGAPPPPEHALEPGLYHADTAQEDLPQGTTLIVSRGIRRDDPDAIPLMVMNDILGGGGFTSRITNRVRSDEGLAYSASSFMQPEVWYDGTFAAFFQSKNETVALATKIIMEEFDRIRNEPVSDEELARAKNGFIEAFPQRFASKRSMLGTFVNDAMTERDPTYWQTYRDRVAAVDEDEVMRVAQEHVCPDEMAIVVVGNWDAIEGGDLDRRADMSGFFDGEVTHLPMLDPLTREPMDRATQQ